MNASKVHHAVSAINEAIERVLAAEALTNQEQLNVIQLLGQAKVMLKNQAAIIESVEVEEFD